TGHVLAYTGAASGTPVATVPSAVLDVIGSTEGDVLYRGASNWSAFAPATAGQFLQTGGSGSTPSWASAVTSIAGNNGAFTLTGGITNSGNAIQLANNSATSATVVAGPITTTQTTEHMAGLG